MADQDRWETFRRLEIDIAIAFTSHVKVSEMTFTVDMRDELKDEDMQRDTVKTGGR
jgi:hypothetical protein